MAFQRKILALVLAGGVAGSLVAGATAAEDTPQPPKQKWSFSGPFGKYDQGQPPRFQGLSRVCQVCHGLALLAFRNLAEPGGPGCARTGTAAIAAEYQVKGEPDDQGEVKDRPGRPPTASRRRSPAIRRRVPVTMPFRPEACR